ncbi:MAG: isopeptide-forming domain-containing fimbrial protein [Lachnospiraceae bacterium]|nr:isopeptide-forming domain-containing fimbrial protein [Lachnospiraceae bacterium]
MRSRRKRIISMIMALVVVLAGMPFGSLPVYGAPSYNLHKVDSLYGYVKSAESGEMSYITNLRDSVVDVRNGAFHAVYSNALNRKCICIDNSYLPEEGKSASWKNIFTVTFKNAGYTSDGRFFNLECSMDTLKMTAVQTYKLVENSEIMVSDIASRGVTARAAFVRHGDDGDIEEILPGISPYLESTWTFRITDKKGNPMTVPPILMHFKDIDIVHTISDKTLREGVQALSGFGSDTYVSSDSIILISEGNSLYEGNGAVENEDVTAHVLMVMDSSEAKIGWHGVTCGTIITPSSLTGYPIPDNSKRVNKESAEMGDTLRYTITTDFPIVSDDNAATSITVTDVLNDILDAENAQTRVRKDGADVGSEWDLLKSGQTLTWQAKNPAAIQGSYQFEIDVKIRENAVLDGREELFIGTDGLVYYGIPNTDSVRITDYNGEEIIITPPDVPVTNVKVGGISLVKDVDQSRIGNAKEGDSLAYTFTITNTSNISLRDIELTDSLDVDQLSIDWNSSSDQQSGAGVLSPGETVRGSAHYLLTLSDINAGRVHNTATVSGRDELGVAYVAEDDADTILGQNPAIDLVKTAASPKAGIGVGDKVEYRFEIANAGNTTLTNISFTDDHVLVDLKWDKELGTLLPGEAIAGSGAYIITQEDVDNGSILNTALVTGTAPDGSEVRDTDDAETEIARIPNILLQKTSDPAIRTGAKAGDEVAFAFVITNTGNCTLQNVQVEDMLDGIRDVSIDWGSSDNAATGAGELSSGESVSGSAFYNLMQADIDRGSLVNRAAATGVDQAGQLVRSEDDAQIMLPENGAIGLVKDSGEGVLEGAKPGDIVHYVFTVTNTGNVTLSGVTIRDEMAGLGTILYDWNGSSDASTPERVLSPGEVVTASADYQLTQADIDAGKVLNTATAVGKTPADKTVEGPDDDLREIPSLPKISLVKEVNRKTYENVKAGDMLTYTLTAANTGNCTLTGVSILDALEGLGNLVYDWSGVREGEGVLLPGEIVRAKADYAITQDDINNGFVTNEAEVIGYSPDKEKVNDKADVTTELSRSAALSVTKTADKVRLANASVGDEIVYTMVAENMGNITVSNVEFVDEKAGLSELKYDWSEASESNVLMPGEKVTVHATYQITQEDIEKGSTENAVTVRGRTPDGKDTPPVEDTVTTPIERKDALKVEKAVDRTLVSNARVGDKLNYTIKVTNMGNTVLHEVVLNDELEGLTGLSADWSGASEGEGTLLPGESMTAKASYSVTQADIDSGLVRNTAFASGINGKDEPVGPEEDDAETKLGGKASFTVNKSVDKATITSAAVGDVLTYTITGQNTGTVTLTDVTLKDTLRGVSTLEYDWSEASCGDGVLLPGESVTATCTYSVTQADISNGKVENTVIMSAKQPDGQTTQKEDKVSTTLKRELTPTPTPVRVNGTTSTPSSGSVTTTTRTVTGSSPAQSGNTGSTGTTGQTVTTSKTGSVRTGDETNAWLWGFLFVSALLTGGLEILRRRLKRSRIGI